MTQELVTYKATAITALTLPDEATFRRDIAAINRFQQIVHATMVVGLDYGVIPGTQKPTLLKPGAEKIAKLLGLADQYEIMDKAEDWQKPFFRYLVKCRLVHIGQGVTISEGLGECNSMESKYRWRWVSEKELPVGVDKTKLVSQTRTAKAGGHWTVYRFDNDDIFSQVNTILKMAKKRALVDASLSAGRLSDVFTQDIEDMGHVPDTDSRSEATAPAEEKTHFCRKHGTHYFMKGKMKGYAHKIDNTDEWCNEDDEPSPSPEPTPADVDALMGEKQRKALFAKAREIGGYDDEDWKPLRALMHDKTGKNSLKELTIKEGEDLIAAVERGESVKAP